MSRLFPDYTPAWESPEHKMLRQVSGEFLAKEATPHQLRWMEQHKPDKEFWLKAGEAGILLTDVPEEFGGGGGDYGSEAVITQELAFALDNAIGFEIHSTITAHYIAAYASDAQKREWLPKMASGEMIGAIAMTEPDTGSDLQAVRTEARRDGDWYVINGAKTWITNGTHMGMCVVVCKTDPTLGAKGISLIAVDTEQVEGLHRGKELMKIGQLGQDTRELFFDNVRVPAANLLGGVEGKGFGQLMTQLARERLCIGVAAAAMAEAAVLETIRYVKERHIFGKPVLDFQNTRFVLAECKADVLALKTMMDYCIGKAIDGTLDAPTASIAKMWGSDKVNVVLDKCLQLFGGYGYSMEYPIGQMYAAARVERIYGGTNEVMKELIGRTL